MRFFLNATCLTVQMCFLQC